jgi:hypothetical protein
MSLLLPNVSYAKAVVPLVVFHRHQLIVFVPVQNLQKLTLDIPTIDQSVERILKKLQIYAL